MSLEPFPVSVEQEPRTSHELGRPRLLSCRFTRTPNGRCRCRVTLGWSEGPAAVGVADGVSSPSGELRCAAEACLSALSQGLSHPRFELVGVKALRAFDTTLVIASLAIRTTNGGPRFVGSVLAPENPVPAAVRAVLHAVNRVIAK